MMVGWDSELPPSRRLRTRAARHDPRTNRCGERAARRRLAAPRAARRRCDPTGARRPHATVRRVRRAVSPFDRPRPPRPAEGRRSPSHRKPSRVSVSPPTKSSTPAGSVAGLVVVAVAISERRDEPDPEDEEHGRADDQRDEHATGDDGRHQQHRARDRERQPSNPAMAMTLAARAAPPSCADGTRCDGARPGR